MGSASDVGLETRAQAARETLDFPYASVVEVPARAIPEKMGPTLAVTVSTEPRNSPGAGPERGCSE